ncbi:MAG: DUF2510 domain-containing protein [Propionibacteriaceae bacterium]|jgi:hypothetical protein|nr:DUF2510 domain-containing protein [Propionibacteriaceae bacterium]
MALKGWYPDPGGKNGHFRYWDGAAWSAVTSTNPAAPPPSVQEEKRPADKHERGWLIALLILLVVTALAMVVIFSGALAPARGTATEDSNSSRPTVSGWDETSTPTPSTPPPPTKGGGELVTCPYTAHRQTTRQPNGQLRADTLTVDRISGWKDETLWLEFTYDLHTQYKTIYTANGGHSWMSNIAVGLMHNDDGFVEIYNSAEQAMQCFASSEYYDHFTNRVDLISEQIYISGHAAWRIRAEIHVASPYFPQVDGDVTDIIVVDLGPDKDYLGFFMSCYTIGDDEIAALVDQAITTLRVE